MGDSGEREAAARGTAEALRAEAEVARAGGGVARAGEKAPRGHSHATLLRKAGVDLGAVQRALGHSSPEITAAIYDHSDLEDYRADAHRGGHPAQRTAERSTSEENLLTKCPWPSGS